MVRDAYSADGQHPLDQAEGSNTQGQSLDIRGSAANLTQELAQLLAASIAQGQAGQRAGTPTGAELASLAALVSASQNQRAMAPSFKDGLSSLSYTPPQRASTGPGVQLTEHHDDEPMPIPSTWRQPPVNDDDKWYRQQIGAAALGLVAGLMVVVPAVLWLSGWLGGPQTRASTARQPAIEHRTADIRTPAVKVQVRPVEKSEVASQYVAASLESRQVVLEPPPVVEQVAAAPQRPRVEDMLAQAERRIENGDIPGAREILASGEGAASGSMMFALAETYDPNMLAAWGTRGVAADVTKARSLYYRARDLGIVRAQVRLDQLR
ncbi:MAG: hypothetical protein K2X43_17950 [Hyphomonadaceae bacterium]|nr:hypothetical protein [Hyphomonadaceae bacterium]